MPRIINIETHGLPDENNITSFKIVNNILYITFDNNKTETNNILPSLCNIFKLREVPNGYCLVSFYVNKNTYTLHFRKIS